MTGKPAELFSKPILNELKKIGIYKLTEIQEKAIPVIKTGNNVLLIAPTGLGKTEAAILPIFDMFLSRNKGENPKGISMLYITPLRSLNRDILKRLVEMGKRLEIRIEVRHGDTPTGIRRAQAKSPPNMLITTPETLQAILAGWRMREHLKEVRWVVIDEIHEFASDKRGVQLTLALERLQIFTGSVFQRIGLSATIGNPKLVGRFLAGKKADVQIIKAEVYREIMPQVESPSVTQTDEEISTKLMIPAGIVSRVRRILELLNEYRTVLIFTNTREHAESLASKIRIISPGKKIGIHHGSLSKEIRIDTEQSLKNGELKAVICTSSLELGIDIGMIDFVVQYMSPRQVTKIVQRIGRSGHVVGDKPKGCIIAAWPDDILESGVILRRALSGELEEPLLHSNALDVLAHQLVGLTLDRGGSSTKVCIRSSYQSLSLFQFNYRGHVGNCKTA
ncbi:MAG: DEAD/DEAH box helicase [Candidatus Bathyarchaeota archaeon]